MSNPTELPDLQSLANDIKVLTCAAHPAGYTAKEARMFNIGFYAGANAAYEKAVDQIKAARQGQPEGEAPQAEPFQQRVQPWMMACFGAEISVNKVERNDRFTEESLELVQACGMTKDRVLALVDYVYDRPLGEPAQEVGGVMVTLAALCLAQGLDMHDAAEVELARIWTKVEAIRAKQLTKPRGSPLPIPAATLSPLCGAQHAESGKVAAAAEKAVAYDELDRIAELNGFASAAAAIAAARRAAQQAASPAVQPVQVQASTTRVTETKRAQLEARGYEVVGYVMQNSVNELCTLAHGRVEWLGKGTVTDYGTSAPGTPEAPQPPFPVSDDEMAALRRFWECASDGEGYDVEKTMMQRLAEMGLVQRKSGAYYVSTDFGLYVLGEYTVERAAQLDGGQEGSAS